VDFARVVRDLLRSVTHAEKVVLVIDNLNTHKPAALYQAFEPAVATVAESPPGDSFTPPNTGSWLNMAEIELSILSRQCLDRRIPDLDTVHPRGGGLEQARKRQPPAGELALHTPMPASSSSASIRQFRAGESTSPRGAVAGSGRFGSSRFLEIS